MHCTCVQKPSLCPQRALLTGSMVALLSLCACSSCLRCFSSDPAMSPCPGSDQHHLTAAGTCCVSAPGVSCLLSRNVVMVIQSCISSVPLITTVLYSSRPFISLAPFGSGVTCLEEFNGGKLQKAWFGENK